MQVIVEPYNPIWADYFQELKSVFEQHLCAFECAIEHVGSTAVVGLAAKPKIDIDIIVASKQIQDLVVQSLAKLGYGSIGDLGIIDRQAFEKLDEFVPYTTPRKKWFDHNLYVCIQGSTALNNHLRLRDHLRKNENENDRNDYGSIKQKLATEFPNDIDAYIDGKTEFILRILSKYQFDENGIEEIRKGNMLK